MDLDEIEDPNDFTLFSSETLDSHRKEPKEVITPVVSTLTKSPAKIPEQEQDRQRLLPQHRNSPESNSPNRNAPFKNSNHLHPENFMLTNPMVHPMQQNATFMSHPQMWNGVLGMNQMMSMNQLFNQGVLPMNNLLLPPTHLVPPNLMIPEQLMVPPELQNIITKFSNCVFPTPSVPNPVMPSSVLNNAPEPTRMRHSFGVIKCKSCTLYPQNHSDVIPLTTKKPPFCKTIWVGGLPKNCTETILIEVFERFGEFADIRKKNLYFGHIRYKEEASVDKALSFSGFRLVIGDSNHPDDTGLIFVDYAKSREDVADWKRHKNAKESSCTEADFMYILDRLKNNNEYINALEVIAAWLDRGECNNNNSLNFFNLIQTASSHVKRLQKEKEEQGMRMKKIKSELANKLQDISTQMKQIEKFYGATSQQKVWDYFTKTQRKNIETWKAELLEMKCGSEDDMDISDEEPTSKRIKLQSNLNEANENLQREIESYKNEIAVLKLDYQKDLNEANCRVEILTNILSTTQNNLDEVIKERNDSKTKIEQLQEITANTSTKWVEFLQIRLDNECKKRDDEIDVLKNINENLEDEIKRNKNAKDEELQDMTYIQEIKSELSSLKSKCNKELVEKEELQHEIELLKDKLKKEQSKFNDKIKKLQQNRVGALQFSPSVSIEEARLIGIISTFLLPYYMGAATSDIYAYAKRFVTSLTEKDLENKMNKWYSVFKKNDNGNWILNIYNTTGILKNLSSPTGSFGCRISRKIKASKNQDEPVTTHTCEIPQVPPTENSDEIATDSIISPASIECTATNVAKSNIQQTVEAFFKNLKIISSKDGKSDRIDHDSDANSSKQNVHQDQANGSKDDNFDKTDHDGIGANSTEQNGHQGNGSKDENFDKADHDGIGANSTEQNGHQDQGNGSKDENFDKADHDGIGANSTEQNGHQGNGSKDENFDKADHDGIGANSTEQNGHQDQGNGSKDENFDKADHDGIGANSTEQNGHQGNGSKDENFDKTDHDGIGANSTEQNGHQDQGNGSKDENFDKADHDGIGANSTKQNGHQDQANGSKGENFDKADHVSGTDSTEQKEMGDHKTQPGGSISSSRKRKMSGGDEKSTKAKKFWKNREFNANSIYKQLLIAYNLVGSSTSFEIPGGSRIDKPKLKYRLKLIFTSLSELKPLLETGDVELTSFFGIFSEQYFIILIQIIDLIKCPFSDKQIQDPKPSNKSKSIIELTEDICSNVNYVRGQILKILNQLKKATLYKNYYNVFRIVINYFSKLRNSLNSVKRSYQRVLTNPKIRRDVLKELKKVIAAFCEKPCASDTLSESTLTDMKGVYTSFEVIRARVAFFLKQVTNKTSLIHNKEAAEHLSNISDEYFEILNNFIRRFVQEVESNNNTELFISKTLREQAVSVSKLVRSFNKSLNAFNNSEEELILNAQDGFSNMRQYFRIVNYSVFTLANLANEMVEMSDSANEIVEISDSVDEMVEISDSVDEMVEISDSVDEIVEISDGEINDLLDDQERLPFQESEGRTTRKRNEKKSVTDDQSDEVSIVEEDRSKNNVINPPIKNTSVNKNKQEIPTPIVNNSHTHKNSSQSCMSTFIPGNETITQMFNPQKPRMSERKTPGSARNETQRNNATFSNENAPQTAKITVGRTSGNEKEERSTTVPNKNAANYTSIPNIPVNNLFGNQSNQASTSGVNSNAQMQELSPQNALINDINRLMPKIRHKGLKNTPNSKNGEAADSDEFNGSSKELRGFFEEFTRKHSNINKKQVSERSLSLLKQIHVEVNRIHHIVSNLKRHTGFPKYFVIDEYFKIFEQFFDKFVPSQKNQEEDDLNQIRFIAPLVARIRNCTSIIVGKFLVLQQSEELIITDSFLFLKSMIVFLYNVHVFMSQFEKCDVRGLEHNSRMLYNSVAQRNVENNCNNLDSVTLTGSLTEMRNLFNMFMKKYQFRRVMIPSDTSLILIKLESVIKKLRISIDKLKMFFTEIDTSGMIGAQSCLANLSDEFFQIIIKFIRECLKSLNLDDTQPYFSAPSTLDLCFLRNFQLLSNLRNDFCSRNINDKYTSENIKLMYHCINKYISNLIDSLQKLNAYRKLIGIQGIPPRTIHKVGSQAAKRVEQHPNDEETELVVIFAGVEDASTNAKYAEENLANFTRALNTHLDTLPKHIQFSCDQLRIMDKIEFAITHIHVFVIRLRNIFKTLKNNPEYRQVFYALSESYYSIFYQFLRFLPIFAYSNVQKNHELNTQIPELSFDSIYKKINKLLPKLRIQFQLCKDMTIDRWPNRKLFTNLNPFFDATFQYIYNLYYALNQLKKHFERINKNATTVEESTTDSTNVEEDDVVMANIKETSNINKTVSANAEETHNSEKTDSTNAEKGKVTISKSGEASDNNLIANSEKAGTSTDSREHETEAVNNEFIFKRPQTPVSRQANKTAVYSNCGKSETKHQYYDKNRKATIKIGSFDVPMSSRSGTIEEYGKTTQNLCSELQELFDK